MAAIFYSRLCIRNSSRLANSLARPSFASSTISFSPRVQSVVFKKTVHSSANRKAELEISPSQPSAHWKGERFVSVALLTLIPTGIIYPSAVVDWALAVVVPLHNHWGVGQVLTDYIHGSSMPKVAKGIWLAVSILQFIGLCYFNYADVGICKAVSMIWHM
ncbi:succinate dehydrogenase [ubiquinone] cytochrome b small subunit A, mitochondrial-like [Stylophora pistillata]|uniref:Succinate dehydrogenase [ubiquinone] cytochrome b small subunit n=1 Tax=Stylophora pistillata TaxID=50429 RepID=A0A2B4SD94_STYPI|nr:succinate dehydrogenase [ubiquinone] cytochrome b small subunit A, mitochondrial-like [Stylophora pistillata]PFX26790.1 Succinate dehydrogenase [ubiquinone] cytochrome b small subunit, mitochondrial [Stylophora pistillata]